jgi:hypothetical protein
MFQQKKRMKNGQKNQLDVDLFFSLEKSSHALLILGLLVNEDKPTVVV